ncbi:MAG: biotin synthase BioB [bacterium]
MTRLPDAKCDWDALSRRVLAGEGLQRDEALAILKSDENELLGLLNAAFLLRHHYFARKVSLHVIRNAKSGGCSEDCAYCSQSSASTGVVPCYPLQSEEELLQGAREAREMGAIRYCIVTSGRSPSPEVLERIARAVRRIKRESPLSICVSLGILTDGQAAELKAAGVDRYNHNLETSEQFFPTICTTHSYAERKATAARVKSAGMELCSGGLMGMGETLEDRVGLAIAMRDVKADSIPLNFLDPRPGTGLMNRPRIAAGDVLRTLALFRFVHPDREIRIAGGREACLGPLQVLALYPANSMFTSGYLTTPGQGYQADRRMLEMAGFDVVEITDA